MRGILVIAAVAGATCSMAAPARVQKANPVRRVEITTMQSTSANSEPEPSRPADLNSPALSEVFRLHALSRRYVEYRMVQELTAVARPLALPETAVSAAAPNIVATMSSIPVPSWMRATSVTTPYVPIAPGCSPLPYRPAGFLGRSAEARRAAFYGMMSAIACEQGIPTGLFDAMIIRESGYNPLATSPKNAFGLAQLMPDTAATLGVDRYDLTQNMRGGARFLRQQLDRFGQVHLALAAYNAGPGRVCNGLMPRIRETQDYVSGILSDWSRLNGYLAAPAVPAARRANEPRTASISVF